MDSTNDMQSKYEPLPRWGHISVAIGDKVYLWGGRIEDFSDNSKKKLATVVEVFDAQSELWEQRATSGKPPRGLYNCAYTTIGAKIFVYGGWDGLIDHGSLHTLDLDSMKWEELKITSTPEAPMKMTGCGLVSYGNDKIILFGGFGVPGSGQRVKGVQFKTNKDSDGGGGGEACGNGEARGGCEAGGGGEASGAGDGDDSEVGEGDTVKILSSMLNGEVAEEESAVSEEEEELKTMTNEVKVFDISTNTWSSPEVSGDTPPPCVDFTFTRVDAYRAFLYGGFQAETGTSSEAYLLNMSNWHWHRMGGEEESVSSSPTHIWPKGRDGHASCVLSGGEHPQVLITGGWDKHNKLLYDTWVMDIISGTWTELPGITDSDMVGGRLWHTVNCLVNTYHLRQLLFFGGSPSPPVETEEGASSDKLASTVLVDLGRVEPLPGLEASNLLTRGEGYGGREWKVLDAVNHAQMGKPLHKMREKVLFTEYRATRAEELVRDVLRKVETMSLHRSATPSIDRDVFASMASLNNKDVPFWVISRQEVEVTPNELGRGKWSVVREAHFRGDKVAAKCLLNPIFSEDNRKIFIECMDLAAKLHHHPNLLPFYGAVLEGDPIILTELMHTNLRQLSEKHELNYQQILQIATEVAKGLEFLHSTKPEPIIHGDLSCTSILLERVKSNRWKAKLSDYMTAKFFRELVSTESSTDFTFSPARKDNSLMRRRDNSLSPPPMGNVSKLSRKESIMATDVLDHSLLTLEKDVYCYGLVLVEMCTGSLPLEISLTFLIESIQWPEVSALVKDCLNHNPSNRPPMTQVIDRLSALTHRASLRPVR